MLSQYDGLLYALRTEGAGELKRSDMLGLVSSFAQAVHAENENELQNSLWMAVSRDGRGMTAKEIENDLEDAIDHGAIVSRLAEMLAKEMGCNNEFCDEVNKAGKVHDIGKLKIGKYLYGRKQNSLKIEEMNYIRMHPTLGYYELKKFGGFSDFVLEAVYHHHENYDGSGYPDNLRKNDIPFAARILRVCDVYAALISERPYRAAFDSDTALELMIDEVKNFDMKIFLAFLNVVHSDKIEEVKCFTEQVNQKLRAKHDLKL